MPLDKGSAVASVLKSSVGQVRSLLDATLQEDAVLIEFSGMSSLPGSEEQQMHSDNPFYDIEQRKNPRILSVFVAMEDITIDKGPTCLYAETHEEWFHELIRADATKPSIYTSDGTIEHFDEEILHEPVVSQAKEWLSMQQPQHAALSAGDLLIFNTTVHHFGTSNKSKEARNLLSFSFQQRDEHGNVPIVDGFTYYILPELVGQYELQKFPATFHDT